MSPLVGLDLIIKSLALLDNSLAVASVLNCMCFIDPLLKINPNPFITILDEPSVTCNPLFVPPKTSRFLDGLATPMPTPSDLIIALRLSSPVPILNCKLPFVPAFNLVIPRWVLDSISTVPPSRLFFRETVPSLDSRDNLSINTLLPTDNVPLIVVSLVELSIIICWLESFLNVIFLDVTSIPSSALLFSIVLPESNW